MSLIRRLLWRVSGLERAERIIVLAYLSAARGGRDRAGREIIVTHHGRQQLLRRLGCAERKVRSVVEKAWRSRQTSKYVNRKRYTTLDRRIRYRLFSGCVFVFLDATADRGALLKTVINPKLKEKAKG